MKLIDLETAIHTACNAVEHYPSEWQEIEDEMRKLPVVEERKHGHWIKLFDPNHGTIGVECSVCKCAMRIDTEYCPYCGAEMDEEPKND